MASLLPLQLLQSHLSTRLCPVRLICLKAGLTQRQAALLWPLWLLLGPSLCGRLGGGC